MDAGQNNLRLSVSDFIALTNQTLEYAYPLIEIEGEVASFKVNQNKYVFFDLKDHSGSVGCFMMIYQLRMAIEDGMKVIVTASPKLTQWGKFSLTVRAIRPSGEGSLKKSFELLKMKLEKEGIFDEERKRPLPTAPQHVAMISSTDAAGYADFIKIINDRWGGMKVDVAHVQVQGADAPDQMIRALQYFNSHDSLPEVILLIRGGGSADDLSAFNDELLVREIAASRAPILIGVGHEVDTSLADLAADVRAATPSNAAQILVPDKYELMRANKTRLVRLLPRIEMEIERRRMEIVSRVQDVFDTLEQHHARQVEKVQLLRRILVQLDPKIVLTRGYALIRGDIQIGSDITIEKSDILITAEVKNVQQK